MSENQFKSMGEFCKAVMAAEHGEVDPRLKRIDEIMPAELEGIDTGDYVSVLIHCKNGIRPIEAIELFIDRPLFGKPPKAFLLESVYSTISSPDLIFAELLYMPTDDYSKRNGDPCSDMHFSPIVRD